ncbi:MAG: hypothetical protein RJA07_1062 [Bacteroidota bacterium]|jgi:hypothetical protein
MEKRGLFCCLLVVCSLLVKAQNLVLNPSFEDISSCSLIAGSFNNNIILNWDSPSFGTPDYYNKCNDTTLQKAFSVPLNIDGFQYPINGNGYGGIMYDGGGRGTREYLQGRFLSLLTIGDKYKIWYYVVSAMDGYFGNNFGAGFASYHVNQPNNYLNITNITPKINYAQVISDTLNWTKVEGTFIADSAYQYIIIGNFFDDLHTISSGQTFFYIDDVHVELLQHNANGSGGVQGGVVVYPNPASSVISIRSLVGSIASFEITDVLGRVCTTPPFKRGKEDLLIDVSALPSSLYFIKTIDENGVENCNKFVKVTN